MVAEFCFLFARLFYVLIGKIEKLKKLGKCEVSELSTYLLVEFARDAAPFRRYHQPLRQNPGTPGRPRSPHLYV